MTMDKTIKSDLLKELDGAIEDARQEVRDGCNVGADSSSNIYGAGFNDGYLAGLVDSTLILDIK